MTSTKDSKKFKMDWTLLLTLLGVIAAWTPFLFEKLKPVQIRGKLISQYDNVGTFRGESKALFLFKLSVVSVNQTFDLKDIDIDIKYEKNGWTHNSSVNQRQTFFTLENKLRKLNVSESSFLNNYSMLKKDEPTVGYLMTTSPFFKDDKITELKVLFKSFNGKTKSLSFKSEEIDETKLLFDDSIWAITDSTKS
jgi:hypothetical protein